MHANTFSCNPGIVRQCNGTNEPLYEPFMERLFDCFCGGVSCGGRVRVLAAGGQPRSFAENRDPDKLASLRQCPGLCDSLCSLRFRPHLRLRNAPGRHTPPRRKQKPLHTVFKKTSQQRMVCCDVLLVANYWLQCSLTVMLTVLPG